MKVKLYKDRGYRLGDEGDEGGFSHIWVNSETIIVKPAPTPFKT